MKLYKLTDENDRTYGGCQWSEGVENGPLSGEGELCGPGWFHAYTDPLLAVLLNPIHANFPRPHLWEAEGEIGKDDCGLKVGCTRLRIIRRIPLPELSIEQLAQTAITLAQKVYTDKDWNTWATEWLNGKDRSKTAAWAAAGDAKAAAGDAEAAAWAVAKTAAKAAIAAAWTAAWTAAGDAKAAEAAAWAAAKTAAEAAEAAAWAADQKDFNLVETIYKIVSQYKED